MLLGSKAHTAGDTRRWIIDYSRWLENTAEIVSAGVTSSSTTCTVNPAPEVLGKEVVFFVNGGTVGETCTVSLVMTDSFGNLKRDSIAFTVVAP